VPNIFSKEKDSKFSKHNLGPRFNSDGEVLKYSIVGEQDHFMKLHKNYRRAMF